MLSFRYYITGKFINEEWKRHRATHITLFNTTIAFNQIWKPISTSHTRQDCVLHNLWLHRTLFPRYFFCDIRHNRCLETESNAFSKSIKATYSFLLSTNCFCTIHSKVKMWSIVESSLLNPAWCSPTVSFVSIQVCNLSFMMQLYNLLVTSNKEIPR